MSKHRRIEITAFRRHRTVVVNGSTGDEVLATEATGSDVVRSSAPPHSAIEENQEPAWLTIDGESSRELRRLIEAWVNSDEAVSAARQAGLMRHNFYVKLRVVGRSLRRLQTRLRGAQRLPPGQD